MKTNNSIGKCTKDMRRHFTKEDYIDGKYANEDTKYQSLGECRLKTTIRYYYTPTKMSKIENGNNFK